jgi:MFS family permease
VSLSRELITKLTQDRSILGVATPKITSEFDSLGDIGWYGSAYLLTSCCSQMFFGKLYAHFSVKWTFLSALAIFEIGSVLCAAAPTSDCLIVGRAVAGLGATGISTGALLVRITFG